MYRRDQEKIVALRLPNMGIKVSSVAPGYAMFWVLLWCFGHNLSFTHPN